MKRLSRLLCPSIALFSLLGCDLFDPQAQAQNRSPVDSMAVFHNLIDAYNTLDYEAFIVCLDSSTFTFVPRDTTEGANYGPWGYSEETELTFTMFNILSDERRIPPLILQVDTSYFSATDTYAFLHANYLMLTPVEEYETLGGGMELEILKRGNYWYITSWKDVEGETIFVEHEPEEGETLTLIDTIVPLSTANDWSDLKVYFREKGYPVE